MEVPMNTHPLNVQDRTRMMSAIREALKPAEAGKFQSEVWLRSQSLWPVEKHLDALVEIVRRSTAQNIEPYLAQVLNEVCSTCPLSQPSMFCQKRYEGDCILFRNARAIFSTIAAVLQD